MGNSCQLPKIDIFIHLQSYRLQYCAALGSQLWHPQCIFNNSSQVREKDVSADADCALYPQLFIYGQGWNEVAQQCCSLHVCQPSVNRHMKCACRVGETRTKSTRETPHEHLCRFTLPIQSRLQLYLERRSLCVCVCVRLKKLNVVEKVGAALKQPMCVFLGHGQ